jgi:ArsR family transcriptional regulator, arsenate/arsenite/antimonite-responsive transcriptional repressor
MALTIATAPGASAESEGCCAPLPGPPLDARSAAVLAGRFKALADPTRLQLLALVIAAGSACICDLTEPVGLSQPTVSHHMKVLVEAGLLRREKRGKWAHFSVVPEALADLSDLLGHPESALAPPR